MAATSEISTNFIFLSSNKVLTPQICISNNRSLDWPHSYGVRIKLSADWPVGQKSCQSK